MGLMGKKPARGNPHSRVRRGREPRAERDHSTLHSLPALSASSVSLCFPASLFPCPRPAGQSRPEIR